MKRSCRAGLVLIFLASPLFSQAAGAPVISVLQFKRSGISEAEVEVFVDYLSSHIVRTGMFRVIDRSQREAILREMEFSQSDCTDEGCLLEIGKLLSANQIIVGSIGKVGERYLLTTSIIDVESGQTIKSASEKYSSLEELIDDTKRVAQVLLGKGMAARDEGRKRSASETGSSASSRNTVLVGAWLDVYNDLLIAGSYYFLLTRRLGVTAAMGYGIILGDLYVGGGGVFAPLPGFAFGLRVGYSRMEFTENSYESGVAVNASLLFKSKGFAFSVDGGLVKNVGGFAGVGVGMNF